MTVSRSSCIADQPHPFSDVQAARGHMRHKMAATSLGLRVTFQLPRSHVRLYSTKTSATGSSGRGKPAATRPEGHVNDAAKELGVTQYYCNRNPRSLELLGMAEKPKGFKTAHRRMDYYHRLVFTPSSRHSAAYVNHNNGTKVVQASTTELCLARHLYKTSDVSAAYNVGRLVAHRCKEMGLHRVMWEHKADRNHKRVKAFLEGVREQGLILNEPKVRTTLPPHGTLPK